MAADPQPQDAQSDDLFGRWLAHHEQQSTDGDETGSAQGTTDHNPPPRASRRMPAAAVASSAVQNDPLIGNRLQAPSSFGVRRPSPNAQPRSGSNEINPEPPSGWEPIVMRSVRKKSEPRVNPLDQPSRFQRLKARFVDPKEPTTAKPEATPASAQPAHPVVTQAPPLPTRSPAPSPAAARSIEETIRDAVPEHQTARHADAPGAGAVAAVEPVTLARDLEPEVAPPTPVRAFIDAPRPKHASEPEPEPVLAEPVLAEPVVAESVVAEAEPEQIVAPQPEPELEPVVAESVVAEAEPEQTVAPIMVVEPEPVAVEPEPEPVAVEPEPEPVAAVETEPEPIAVVEPEPVAVIVEPEPVPVAAVEPEPEPIAVVEPEPVAVIVEPEPVPVVVEPEPEPEAVAAPESDDEPPAGPESRLASLLHRHPKPAKPAEPEPVAAAVEPEPVAAAVEPEPVAVVEPEPEPEPEAVAAPESEDEPPADPESRLAFLLHRQPKPAKPVKQAKRARSNKPKAPEAPKLPKPGKPGTGDAARDLVAAKAAARAAAPAAPPPAADAGPAAAAVAVAAPPEPEPAPVPKKGPKNAPTNAPKKASKHDQVAAEMPGLYTFKQKKNSRRLLTIALMVGLVVSAYFAKAAYDTQDTASMGLAAIVVLATAMLWAIRAGAAPTKLQVHQGQLEVVRQGERFVFDLASPYTQVEVRGRPGRHGWKVLFPRRGMTPFSVDATMVDADDFMRVLRFFRPELVNH